MAVVGPWLAIYTKSRNEKKVADRLEKQGIETYLPLQEQKRKWSDRYKTVKVPIISSYVFLRIDEKRRTEVLQDPGVLNFVFWLGKPAHITDDEINRIKYILKEAGAEYNIETSSYQSGDEVQIESGSFAGQTATVQKVSKKDIYVVLKSLGLVLRLSPIHLKGN